MSDPLASLLDQAADDALGLDLSGAVDFADLEPGQYLAVITKVEASTSKVKEDGSGGNPMLTWSSKVDDDTSPFNDSFIPRAYTVTAGVKPRGLSGAAQWIKALGHDTTDPSLRFSPSSAVGQHVLVTVRLDKRTGYLEVSKVEPVPTADPLG